ncbi:MAG: GxxExxY protein [Candidatus Methanoperedens sp.]|nr:GxxExxY protein [Candidatus Methanoperedens sp.]
MDENELSNKIGGAAIEVHRTLGPGLLESTYEECLCHELLLNELLEYQITQILATTIFALFAFFAVIFQFYPNRPESYNTMRLTTCN